MSGAAILQFPAPHAHKHTVLIVDDEALIRMVLAECLKDHGFEVLEAPNGDAAVELIKQDPSQIDLIFSDVRMPGSLDGLGLAKWVRDSHLGIPLFLTSGDIANANVVNKLWAGEPFFSKPYDFEFVTAKIQEAISDHRRRFGHSPSSIV